MNSFQKALRDFQDFADDVSRSRFRTFDDAMRRLVSTLVPGTPLGDVVALLPLVPFDEWYSEQVKSVRGMVGSGVLNWPEDRLERLALQVGMMRSIASGDLTIVDFSHKFLYVSSNRFDDYVSEFVQQYFRPFARDLLRFAHDSPEFASGLRVNPHDREENPSAINDLSLFVCHSAADAGIAEALVKLVEKCLKVSARNIRCTSVDGYRLGAGADTNEVLRTEVFHAQVLVAILTPRSLSSAYVLFELGARWGARKPLFPVLAAGATPRDLEAPLSGLNALAGTSSDQMLQLMEDTAKALSLTLEPMGSYSKELGALVAAATSE